MFMRPQISSLITMCFFRDLPCRRWPILRNQCPCNELSIRWWGCRRHPRAGPMKAWRAPLGLHRDSGCVVWEARQARWRSQRLRKCRPHMSVGSCTSQCRGHGQPTLYKCLTVTSSLKPSFQTTFECYYVQGVLSFMERFFFCKRISLCSQTFLKLRNDS